MHPRAKRLRSEVRQEPRTEEEDEDRPDIEEMDAYIYSMGTEPFTEETTARDRSSRDRYSGLEERRERPRKGGLREDQLEGFLALKLIAEGLSPLSDPNLGHQETRGYY